MNSRAFLSAIVASAALAMPATSQADHHDGGGWHGGGWHGGDWHHDGHHHGFFPFFWGPSIGVSFYNDPYYYDGYYGSPYGYGGYYGRPYGYGAPYAVRGGPVDSLGADVQIALQRRGYYRGVVDGVIGPGSRAAIRGYQHDRGLAVTGRIDSSLLRSLRID